jgi:hypothetical protein
MFPTEEAVKAFDAAMNASSISEKLTVEDYRYVKEVFVNNLPHEHQAAADHEACNQCGKTFSKGVHSV